MRWRAMIGFGLLLAALTGCVERRFVIESDPPGALVLVNGQPLGSTPVDGHFVYYGNYTFTLVKDGYETLQVDQCIRSPWYQYPPLDFVSENVYPGKMEDVRRFRYALQPATQVNTQQLLQQAEALRNRGQQIPNSDN
jgi:PEGA domain